VGRLNWYLKKYLLNTEFLLDMLTVISFIATLYGGVFRL